MSLSLRAALHPVVAHLLDRARGREGAPWRDGRRIALVVEGGGVRSVITAGALAALRALELHNVFDLAYATSAGAINACYFLAGAIAEASTLYEDRLCDGRFISKTRPWRLIDIDHLIDGVLPAHQPLDRAALKLSPTELHIATTEVRTGAGALWSHRDERVDVMDVVRASCAVPLYAGGPVHLLEGAHVDGFVANPLPVLSALAAGCSDVLVVFSYPFDGRPRRLPAARHYLEALLLSAYPAALRGAYARRIEVYNANAMTAFAHGERTEAPRVCCLVPGPGDAVPSQVTTDSATLRKARLDAYRRTLAVFGVSA